MHSYVLLKMPSDGSVEKKPDHPDEGVLYHAPSSLLNCLFHFMTNDVLKNI